MKFLFIVLAICFNSLILVASEVDKCAAALEPVSENVIVQERNKDRIHLKTLSNQILNFVLKFKRAPTIEEIVLHSTDKKLQLEGLQAYFSKSSAPTILDIIASARTEKPEKFTQLEIDFAKVFVQMLKENIRMPKDAELADALNVTVADMRVIYGSNKNGFALIRQHKPKEFEQYLNKILIAYTRLAKASGKDPSKQDLANELDIDIKDIESLIGENKLVHKYNDLFDLAVKRNANSFKGIQNTAIFSEERLTKAVTAMIDSETIVLTSADAGAPVNMKFLKALETYNKDNNAPVFVRPVNLETTGLQPELLESKFAHVIINTILPTRGLSIHNLKLIAKMVNPLTGQKKFGPGETRIFGHPQFRLETKAHINSKFDPVFHMTTGSITVPNYLGGRYIQERTAQMATERHYTGALILEKTSAQRGDNLINIEGVGRFHMRNIEFVQTDAEGNALENPYFMDLNKAYYSNGVVKTIRAQALMFGDFHFGATDQRAALEAKHQLLKLFLPRRVYVEDDFDGNEINHHERLHLLSQAKLAGRSGNILEEGLLYLKENLESILVLLPKDSIIIRKRSNHPHWVVRYLQDGQFMKEPQNTILGLELAKAMVEGMDPIDYYLKKHMEPSLYNRIKTLAAGETTFEGSRPVLTSFHGDKGIGGAKASMQTFVESVEAAVYGHTHTLEAFNRIINIPGNVEVPQSYAQEGFNKTLIGNAVIGPDGQIQFLLYDRKSGEYFRDRSKPLSSPEQFFAPGYPKVVPTDDPTLGARSTLSGMDQYYRKK